MCLVGVFAMGLTYLSSDYMVLIITGACGNVFFHFIHRYYIGVWSCECELYLSLLQVMLLSYSIGSLSGLRGGYVYGKPITALWISSLVLLVTAIYMLFAVYVVKAHCVELNRFLLLVLFLILFLIYQPSYRKGSSVFSIYSKIKTSLYFYVVLHQYKQITSFLS